MKYIPAIISLTFCNHCYSQIDSSAAPVKIFFAGSFSIVGSWEPTEGKLYSMEWYNDTKPKNHSFGNGFGLTTGIKIFRRTYLLTGIDFFHTTFDEFRVTPAPDPRYYPVIHDTSYFSYTKKLFSIPVGIQLPLYFNGTTIAAHLGAAGEFTYYESYKTMISDTSNGSTERKSYPFKSEVTRYTGTRIETGVDVEFRNMIGNTFLHLGINYTSPSIGNYQSEKYFLTFGPSISFSLGVGYYFVKKKKEIVEYTLL